MTLGELQERIKEEIVLRKGQVKERHWRQTGLLTDAADLGLSPEEFMRQVNEVGRRLDFGKLDDLRSRIEDTARKQQKKLTSDQLDAFGKEAERLSLAASFATSRWIPDIVDGLPDSAPAVPSPPPVTTNVSATEPKPAEPEQAFTVSGTGSSVPAPFAQTPLELLRRKIAQVLDGYNGHIPSMAIRPLFVAFDADENVIADEILAYLSARYYASETTPTGQSLKEKLLSTDWRDLKWWVNQVPASVVTPASPPRTEPITTGTTHPMVDTNYQGPPAAAAPPAKPASSRAGLWGVVFAVAFLLILYWLLQGAGKNRKTQNTDRNVTVEQPTKRKLSRAERRKAAEKAKAAEDLEEKRKKQIDVNTKADQPVADYDRILDDRGEYGESAAQKDGKWGLWRKGKWMILPIYDDITLFQDGKAHVVLGNYEFDIDRFGNRLEE